MLVEDESTGHERLAPHGPESTTKKRLNPKMQSSKSNVHKMNAVHPVPAGTAKSFHKFGITAEEILKIDGILDELNKHGGVKGLAHKLRVDPTNGIEGNPEELKFRTDTYGANTYPVKEQKHFLEFLWEACQDETLLILVVCAVVSLVVGLTTESLKTGWYDGAGIGFAVILVVCVASTSDWKQSLQFRELSAEKRKIQITVSRSGRRLKILIFDLVVGDIVHLNIGDQIPGDGVLVEGHSLVIDESSMTGESDPMAKDPEKPFLLSGCKVLDGFGTMMVTTVGMNTEWGKVMATLSEEVDESTPLQERLDSLATTIGKVGLGVAIIVFFVLLIRLLATTDLKHFTGDDGNKIVDFFAIAVTIVVVAVPEGLPLAVTLTLAYSMAKMMDDRALVRHLAACETMGSATTICSDKTGTLTMNQMTVVNNWMCGKLRKTIGIEGFNDATVQLIYQSICLNTNGNVHFKPDVPAEVTGTPTETAVLSWGVKLGAIFPEIKAANLSRRDFQFNQEAHGSCFPREGW
jgi:Ca2+-transporting ATPase